MKSKVEKTTKDVWNLHSKGLTNIEISKKLNIPVKKILSDLNRYGLKSNRYLKIEETNELKQFILGSILGDGYLSRIEGKDKNSKLALGHGIKQKEYCKFKHEFLSKYNLEGKFRYTIYPDSRTRSGFSEGYCFKTKTHPIFSFYRKNFYINNKKIINKELISQIDAFGIAIWFMDDSSKAKSGYQIQTCSFSKEEILFLSQLLKDKFNISSTYQPHANILYIKKESIEIFNNLIKPYIIPSMEYKLFSKSSE